MQADSKRERAVKSRLIVEFATRPDRLLMYDAIAFASMFVRPKTGSITTMLVR